MYVCVYVCTNVCMHKYIQLCLYSLAQELFDECDDHLNKNLAMITTIYVNHQTKLEDYVTNIALICPDCKYLLLKKICLIMSL